MPSAAAAAGAACKATPDDGVAGGAMSPAAAAAAACDSHAEKQSAPESSHPPASEPSMDVIADNDGSKARQVCRVSLLLAADASNMPRAGPALIPLQACCWQLLPLACQLLPQSAAGHVGMHNDTLAFLVRSWQDVVAEI